MSNQVPVAYVEGYRNAIYMESQQKIAKLFGKSRVESQNSKREFYERIGQVELTEVTTRHGDTPLYETPHSRRAVDLVDADYADLVDTLDRVRMLINPTDSYVQAAVAAVNRRKDRVFIAAALGSAKAGEEGDTLVALPNTQKVAATDGTNPTGLNALTITRVLEKFNVNDVDADEVKYFAIGSKEVTHLLNDEKTTNAEYATVKALANGKIETFAGFSFVMSNLLPVTAAATTFSLTDGSVGSGAGTMPIGARRCFAWAPSGMISAEGAGGMGLSVSIDKRPDKRNSYQVYVVSCVGAARLEEVKVVEVLVKE